MPDPTFIRIKKKIKFRQENPNTYNIFSQILITNREPDPQTLSPNIILKLQTRL